MRIVAALLVAAFALQDIPWKTTWPDALKEAKEQKKLAILVFFNKGVRDCKRFEEQTLKDAAVITALKRHACALIDPEGTDDDNRLWQQHQMPNPPMTYIYDPEGKKLAEVSSLNPKLYAEALDAAGPAYFYKIVPAREALAKDPNQPDKLVMLGDAYCSLNSPEESSKNYKKAVELFVQKGDKATALKTLEAQLSRYYDLKWYSPARDCCRQLAELDPSNATKLLPRAAWVLGMADCAEGQWQAAISGLKVACEKYADSEILDKMMFTLASAYMYAKDKTNAIIAFQKLIEKFPDSESAEIARVQLDKLVNE